MKKVLYILLFLSPALFGQYKDGKELLRDMHKRYAGNYCQTVTFDQRTIKYDSAGATKDTSYWYEWISYPDKFRIDFGKKFGGNCVIFKNDSAFNYRNHKLVKKEKNENDLLLLLGGMYFRPIDTVLTRLERAGYGFNIKFQMNGDKLVSYTLTKDERMLKNDQEIRVDAKDLKVTSLKMKLNDNGWLEISFDKFKKSCKGFTETKVSASINGKLEQREEYLNLKTSVAIPDSIFNKK